MTYDDDPDGNTFSGTMETDWWLGIEVVLDAHVPGPPHSLTAEQTAAYDPVFGAIVELDWEPPLNNGGIHLTGYVVER